MNNTQAVNMALKEQGKVTQKLSIQILAAAQTSTTTHIVDSLYLDAKCTQGNRLD